MPNPDLNVFEMLRRALFPVSEGSPEGNWQLRIPGGTGGTSTTDNTAFTPGASSLTPMGGYYGPRTVLSGNVAVPALSNSAILQVDVVAGGAGGGVSQTQVQGTAGTWVNVGFASGPAGAAGNWPMPVQMASGHYPTVNIGGITGSVYTTGLGGSVGAIGAGGSIGVTQITSPWVIHGSVQAGLEIVGTDNINRYRVGFQSGNLEGYNVIPVVYASGRYPTVNLGQGIVGSVNTVVLAGSLGATQLGAPWTITGSVFTTGLGGSVGVIGAGGSMGVTQIGAPWTLTGSVVTTGAGGSVGVVQITSPWGISGSVYATANIPNIVQVDTRGSRVPTVWPIALAGSGYYAIAAPSANPAVACRLYAITLINTGTATIGFQCPSGTWLTGSMRILPGAGFAQAAKLGNPLLIGATNATFYLFATGSENIGGFAAGWVE